MRSRRDMEVETEAAQAVKGEAKEQQEKKKEAKRIAVMKKMHTALQQQQQILKRIFSFLDPMEQMTPRAYNTFQRVKSTIYMGRAHKYFGMFDCLVSRCCEWNFRFTYLALVCVCVCVVQLCYNLEADRLELKQCTDESRIAELRKSIAAAEKHRDIRFHQQRTLTARRAAVRTGETVIQMDFCQLDLMPLVQVAKKSLQFVHNLVMVMETVTATGVRRTQYIDFIADGRETTNDFWFLCSALKYLINNTNNYNILRGITRINLWSDGCSKHFKSRYVQAFIAALQASHPHLTITWDFTAPHHGHGKADAHGGHLSQLLRNTLLQSEGLRKRQKLAAVVDRFDDLNKFRTLDDVATLIKSRVSNVTVIQLNVDRSPELKPSVRPLHGIRRFFSFKYPSREKINMAERSDVDPFENFSIVYTNETVGAVCVCARVRVCLLLC